ncbi:cytochrome P450 monooxygenase pc-3 [Mycena pura]|uniref:Cytochrome P450 monooxygenase pc-3 n=1 Tax=Mycena pura TaxID=153505 RepID=A0AAD6VGF2_9AGAR|nr:cytochrome P450 monooxygenase pc-3 [Mycena pura]
MEIPPGLSYLVRVLPLTLLPCAATYAVLTHILPFLTSGALPLWSRVAAALLAQPAGVFLSDLYEEHRQARDAASRGAVRMPVIHDKWPLGLSVLSALKESVRSGYPGALIQDWIEEHGNTFITKVLLQKVITTVEPHHVKAILATEFDDYWKGPSDSRLGQSLLGFGVFNTDGERPSHIKLKDNMNLLPSDELWRFHRNLARPFFSRERISDFDIFDRHAQAALSLLKKRLADGYPVDFQDLSARFTLDSAAEFLFGRSVDSMSAGLPYPDSSPLANEPSFLNHPSNTYVRSFVQSQILTTQRAAFGNRWPLVEFWRDRVKPHRKIIDAFIEPILNEELKKKHAQAGAESKGNDDDDDEGTFLTHLVQATDDKEIIRDSIFNILIAGRDTTAATLTFGVYMLAEHPDIVDRLRHEILSTVGSSKMPTYDDLRSMKYLRAFINETLRLYPPVAAKNATTWPPTNPGDKPLYVPAKARCRYSVFVMHRRTDLWGPDALKFDPDRFLDERVRKYLTPNPFIFLPFNAGPRICLDQQFAYYEASFFLVRLLQNFVGFSLAPDAQPEASKPPASWKNRKGTQATEKIRLGLHLTMYSKGGLWVRMNEVASE